MKKNYVLQLETNEDLYRDICVVDDYAEALRVMLNNIEVDRKLGIANKHRICEIMVEFDEAERGE